MKKAFLLTLMALFAILIMGACASEPASGTDTGTQAPQTEQGAAAQAGQETTQPHTEPPSQLSVLVWDRGNPGGTDPTDNFYTRWIQEQVLEELNIEVTFQSINRWPETTLIVNQLAAGIAPDLAITFDGSMVNTFGRQGGVLNLTPLLEEHLPSLPYLESFLGDNIWMNQDPVSGELFSMMQVLTHHTRNSTFIRQDWLDILGLPAPTTTDEFVDALRAFRDYDPGNVGAGNVVPLAMTSNVRSRANNIMESFIPFHELSRREIFMYNVAERYVLFPGYKEGVRLMNMMFNEGLIDPDFALHSDDVAGDDMAAIGRVGAYIHNWDHVYRAHPGIQTRLQDNVPGGVFAAVDPFTNPGTGESQKIVGTVSAFIFVPATSRNPVGALQYLDWMSRLENRRFLQIGEYGYTHTIVNDTVVMMHDEGERIMNSLNNFDLTLVVNGLDLGSDEENIASISVGYPGVNPALVAQAYRYATHNVVAMPIVSVPGGLPFEDSFGPTFHDLIEQLLAVSITAPVDQFDDVWDSMMEGIMQAGAARAMEARWYGYIGVVVED